jgi:hypothetical protein
LAEGFLCDVQADRGFGSRVKVESWRQSQKLSNGKPDALSSSQVKITTKSRRNHSYESAKGHSDHLPSLGESNREKSHLKTVTESDSHHPILPSRLFQA